jgi:hypothetical protein
MSFDTSVTFMDGKIFMEMPEDVADGMILALLREYRQLVLDSMDYEAERFMVEGVVEEFRLANVRSNMEFLSAFDRVIEYVGGQDAE